MDHKIHRHSVGFSFKTIKRLPNALHKHFPFKKMVCLKGLVALITGGSGGIGAATAIHFASLDCAVAINGRNEAKLKQVVDECLKTGIAKQKVLAVIGDVSNEEDAAAIVQKTVAHFGKLDILINNAGFSILNPNFEKVPLSDFDSVMKTNVRALLHMTQLAAPHLKKTKGNVVNVSSVISHRIFPNSHIYAASKAAVDSMTKTMALSLADDGIRVNAVNPGGVRTNFMEAAGVKDKAIHDAFVIEAARVHALKRMGDPMEIAKPIAFLASSDASFMTGSIILVDGGYVLTPPGSIKT